MRDLFTSLLDLPWIWIIFLFVFCFVTSWVFFGGLWYLLMTINGDFSSEGLNKTNKSDSPCVIGVKTFGGVFLYSIESQQTIGYGTRSLNEDCTSGIILLIIQSCFGLIIQSLWVGLIYTKLTRPKKRRQTLMWSSDGVICLRDGYLTFQCRLGDMRERSTLIEPHIRMYFIKERITMENEIIPFNLIDMNVGFNEGKDRLILNWPIIIEHRIDCQSPLFHLNQQNFFEEIFEILVVLEGIIETTGMITQTKRSYIPQEIIWGGRFENIFHINEQHIDIDYSKFNSISKDNYTTDRSAKQIEEDRIDQQ